MEKRITDIQSQRKNSPRKSIYLDGEFFCSVDGALIIKFGLRIGLSIDEDVLRKIIQEDEILKAKSYAFDLLVRRSYTQKEMYDKLAQRYAEDAISTTMETLERLGYIKDEEYAKNWVESRKRHKPKGKKALRMELMRKGIDKGTISRVLSEIDDSEEFEMAMEVAKKQIKRYKNLEPNVVRRRLYGFLERRGFDYETINDVLRYVMSEE
ncbi:TPA: regulatory protein RecX [Candidatus Poribacteria bacterium]|nr:regulatory protein RecX [Candidatus Poribacteria bacterium]